LVENKETFEIEIHDLQNSKLALTQEKMDGDRQLALYSIAIKEIFGKEKKVKLIWH
jgi:hypothetical protein